MKLEKAIEILTLDVQHLPPGVNDDFIDAEKLGIEALIWIRDNRVDMVGFVIKRLPGETTTDEP